MGFKNFDTFDAKHKKQYEMGSTGWACKQSKLVSG